MAADEQTSYVIAEVITEYLDQLNDPGEVDSGELAENIALHLQQKGLTK